MKESAHDIRKFLKTAERADGLDLKVILTHDDAAADPVVLYVIPDPLIRVKIGCVFVAVGDLRRYQDEPVFIWSA